MWGVGGGGGLGGGEVAEGYAPYMGMVGGSVLGGEGRGGESQKGMHPTWGLVIVESGIFEGRGVLRGFPGA